MVNGAEPDDTDEGVPLEWRRHFYDGTDLTALTFAVLAGLVSIALLGGAATVATVESAHPSVIAMLISAAAIVAGMAVAMTGLSGALPRRRNKVTVAEGITYVRAGADLPRAVGAALIWFGAIALGIGYLAADRAGIIGFSQTRYFLPFLITLAVMIIYTFWALAFRPKGRHLEFSPDALSGRFGATVIRIPWDAIVSLSINRGPSALRPFGLGRRAEATFATTAEATLPHAPKGSASQAYPIWLIWYDVDEDTLYNVILAARSHPEIRHLLGREEGTILFDGPPPETRRAMLRSQVWLPWEQQITAALGRGIGAEPTGESPLPAAD